MKKILLLILALMCAQELFAQLKPPTSTTRDTLVVVSCYYDHNEVRYEDAPCKFFEETTDKIYIAGQVYTKGKATYSDAYKFVESWGGHVTFIEYNNASVNGKRTAISVVKPWEDCTKNNAAKYMIGDYTFYVYKLYQFAQEFDWTEDYARHYLSL